MADSVGKDVGHFFGIPADVPEPEGLESTWTPEGYTPDYMPYAQDLGTSQAEFYANLQRALAARQAQEGLVSQLQAQARGEGPSIAQLMYEQRRQEALKDQASLASSTRGMRSATSQRALTEQASESQRKAVLEAAMLRLQEQQAAQKMLGESAGQMRGQDYQGAGMAGQMYGTQSQALNAQNQGKLNFEELKQKDAAQRAQAALERYRLAVAQEQARAQAWGNLGKSLLGAGGDVGGLGQNLLKGGGTTGTPGAGGDKSAGSFGNPDAGGEATTTETTEQPGGGDPDAGSWGNPDAGGEGDSSDDFEGYGDDDYGDDYGGDDGDDYAMGGYVQRLKKMASGGVVPGKPVAKGNSPRNDKVPAMARPGEVVLPRTVANGENAPDKAHAFVQALKCGGSVRGYAEGGDVTAGPAPITAEAPEASQGAALLSDKEMQARDDAEREFWRRFYEENPDLRGAFLDPDDPLIYIDRKSKDGESKEEAMRKWDEEYRARRAAVDAYGANQQAYYDTLTADQLQEIYRRSVLGAVSKEKANFLAQQQNMRKPGHINWALRTKDRGLMYDDATWVSRRVADRDALNKALDSAKKREWSAQESATQTAGGLARDASAKSADEANRANMQRLSRQTGIAAPSQVRMDTSAVPPAQLDYATKMKVQQQNAVMNPTPVNSAQQRLNEAEKNRDKPTGMADGGYVTSTTLTDTELGDQNVPAPSGQPGMLTQTSSATAPDVAGAGQATNALSLGDQNVFAARASLRGALGYAEGGEVDPSTGMPQTDWAAVEREDEARRMQGLNRTPGFEREAEMNEITRRQAAVDAQHRDEAVAAWNAKLRQQAADEMERKYPEQRVPVMLSPGEIVVDPKTAQSPDKTAEFVSAIKSQRRPQEYSGVLMAERRAQEAAQQAAPPDEQPSEDAAAFVRRMASPDGRTEMPAQPDQRAAGAENFEAVLSSKPDTATATNAARDWMREEYQQGRSMPNLAVQRLAAQYGYDSSFVDGMPILFKTVPKKAAPMRNKSRR